MLFRLIQDELSSPQALPPCWICGQPAATREHRAKASDLLSLFGVPTQQNPLYFHTAKRRNRQVGSLKSDVLKFSNRICAKCNGATTQPHDYAWQHFSRTVRAPVPAITPGIYLRPSRIFTYNSRAAMLDVHLYFLKLFGCQIVEGGIPIEIGPFARAILDGKPHENVYLAFGPTPSGGSVNMAGGSDVHVAMLGHKCAFAAWFYEVGPLSVNLMHAIPGERREGLVDTWHPRMGCKRIKMRDFESPA